jgi:membrane protein CcdC involved in cytochrome C biogenesis
MPGVDRSSRRRNSLYVKQNKAYQMLLATLIIVFIVVTAVVVNGVVSSNPIWRESLFIRMIIERNGARSSR